MVKPESDVFLREALDFVTGAKVKRPKTTLPLLNTPKDTPISDREILENPPEATYYNSYEGSKIINGQKYFHGETDCFGKKVHAPILSDEEWAAMYETFPIKKKVWNEVKQRYDNITSIPVTKLSSIDQHFMTLLNQYDRLVLLAYREIHKTTNSFRKIKRMLLDLHLSVVYYSDTSDHAERFSAKLRHELKYNPKLLRDYGYVIDETQMDRTNQFYFVWQGKEDATKDPGCTIGSMDGTGQMGGHPDVIMLDDVINEKSAGSEARLQAAKDWYSRQVEPMAKENTYIWVVGTIKDPDDLYHYLEKTDMWHVEKIPAIIEWPNMNQFDPGEHRNLAGKWYYTYHQNSRDKKPMIRGVAGLVGGQVSFDEYHMEMWESEGRERYFIDNDMRLGFDKVRMSMQEFLLVRRKIGIEAFESEYQMNSVKITEKMLDFDRIRLFNPEIMGFYDELKMNCVAFYDQALGHSNQADFNCVAIVSEYLEEYYILDIIIWKNKGDGVFGKERVIDEILRVYPFISVFAIEADLAQTSDADMLCTYYEAKGLNIQRRYQNRLNTDEDRDTSAKVVLDFEGSKIKVNKKAKVQRIYNQWSGRLLSNRVYMREGINLEAMNEFLAERSFPFCTKFDVLDALGSAFDEVDKGCSNIHFFGGK